MNHHLRFTDSSARPRGGSLAALALCAFAAPFFTSCSTTNDRLLSVSETVPPLLARDKPFIHVKCYFLTAPKDFDLLASTKGNHVGGIFSPQDGEKLLQSLQRRKQVDLIAAPSMTVRQGQRSKMEVVRELVYPTAYSAPQIPKDIGKHFADGQPGIFPVTPAAPESFETRNIGITADFEGSKNSRNEITFKMNLERTAFLGFINYGSPITAPATTAFGKTIEVTITENRVEMPVFDTKRLTTTLTLADGHYVALGGLNPNADSLKKVSRPPTRGADPGADQNFFVLIKVRAVDANGN